MQVNKAEILTSAVSPKQYPDANLPEIALAGRSNVGKSSFINKLIKRKALARTSSQPGRTQTLNFYQINDQFRFVDVPGYGYARVSKKDRQAWAEMIDEYLNTRENIVLLILLMDIRNGPTELDINMQAYADELGIPYIIVLTKLDKIKPSQKSKHIKPFMDAFSFPSEDHFFLFSAETGEGSSDVWDVILDQIEDF